MSREYIPKGTREALLNEYDHKCAVCGVDRPQLHHIDEDHSNSALENLLPLCPNCHLRDQHNPTRKIDIQKLVLFRKYKDPTILKPQFDPIYTRQVFLSEVEINDEPVNFLTQQAKELAHFISSLTMGEFYGKKIYGLMSPVNKSSVRIFGGGPDPAYEKQKRESYQESRQKLVDNKEEVQRLIVELLRYQSWANV